MKYLYPCKPNPLSPESRFFAEIDRDISWAAEIKKDGWRCMVYRDKKITLWTRHKTTIQKTLSFRDSLLSIPEQTILDGELLKNSLYLFDILMFRDRLLIELPLFERRKYLEEAISRISDPAIEIATQVRIGKVKLYYEAIEEKVNEGIVLKKLDSKYLASETRCLQNPFWLKVKKVKDHIRTGELI